MADTHSSEHHGPGFKAYMVVFVALSIFTAVSFVVNSAVRSGSITATTGLTATEAANLLTITQGANVRSGPGEKYYATGTLKNPGFGPNVCATAPLALRSVPGPWLNPPTVFVPRGT